MPLQISRINVDIWRGTLFSFAGGLKYLNAALTSVKAASVGLIFAVALSIMISTAFNIANLFSRQNVNFDCLSFIIMITAFVLHIHYEINPIVLTIVAGVIGWIFYFI